nr:hypothetical protein [Tanacetum cinerariifolium]
RLWGGSDESGCSMPKKRIPQNGTSSDEMDVYDEDEREPMFIHPHDPDYVPEPIYLEYIPLEDKYVLPAEDQPLPPVVSPTAGSPEYVVESDPKEDPEEFEDDETEDGSVDYPMDGGDDGDDDYGESSRDDTDDEDEDEEDEEEEHFALADFTIVKPTDELVSPPEGTEPVIPPPSTNTTATRVRITTDTTGIPTEIPIIAPTIPPSPDYTSVSPDYSHASETESDPSEDPSSGHIPPLPAVSPFLSSDDDTTDSDTPDMPPSPTHGTPFTEITASTQRSPIIPQSDLSKDPSSGHIPPLPVVLPFLSSDDDTTDSDTPDTPPSPTYGTLFIEITASTQRSPVIPRRRVMILAPRQPISHGQLYRYYPNGPVHMMTARKRVGSLPV